MTKPMLQWPAYMASPLQKGLGALPHAETTEEITARRWNLLHEDLSLPTAVLRQQHMLHNAAWMQKFVAAYGLKLAPHGKTTMAPALFHLQLQHGACGITVATAHQAAVAYHHGVRRVLMANQLVGRANMQIIAGLLNDPDFTFYGLVDSAAQVEQLGRFFADRRLRLHVLLELGVTGGRAGVRDETQLRQTLAALAHWREHIVLAGVELYEGVLDNEEAIRALLRRAVATVQMLMSEGWFHERKPLLSGAGSAWYDVVAEEFAQSGLRETAELILRPGCYLTHDVGAYSEAQQRILASNPVAHSMQQGLRPALEVWAYVQSVPEPQRAIVGLGKRDAAFDAGLPLPALHYRPGSASPAPAPAHWRVTKLMDQHAYLAVESAEELAVGDMIGFHISHPCLTFDKWRSIAVIDEEYNVVDVVQTYF
jgi:D-serine dehydratase